MSKDYVPGPNNEFNDFQINLVLMVVANAVAWGIAAGKVTALQAAQTIYQPLYDAIVNVNNRTKAQVTNHQEGRKLYEKYIRIFVKENLVNNTDISAGEKEELGLNPGTNTNSPRPQILTPPILIVKILGNGLVRIECLIENENTRPSIHPDADGLEFRFSEGPTPPANAGSTNTVFFSTKARFTKLVDFNEIGQTLYMFARWKNNTDDSKSGPWCDMVTAVIR